MIGAIVLRCLISVISISWMPSRIAISLLDSLHQAPHNSIVRSETQLQSLYHLMESFLLSPTIADRGISYAGFTRLEGKCDAGLPSLRVLFHTPYHSIMMHATYIILDLTKAIFKRRGGESTQMTMGQPESVQFPEGLSSRELPVSSVSTCR